MSKKMDFTSGKTKKVTHMPLWILKLKGRLDSGKGQGVCDEYIFTLLRKEQAIEASEVIKAEKILSGTRKQAAGILATIAEKENSNSKIAISEKKGTVQEIRANRANSAARSANIRAINSAILTLAEIYETIIFVETILEEGIAKLRAETNRICHAYVRGVRAGKLKEYVIPFKDFEDKAIELYKTKHEELYSKIHEIVSNKDEE